jgi:hypothetical protein
MKFISHFLSISFILIVCSASIASSDLSPIIGGVLSYVCYKIVFEKATTTQELYDPIDYIEIEKF